LNYKTRLTNDANAPIHGTSLRIANSAPRWTFETSRRPSLRQHLEDAAQHLCRSAPLTMSAQGSNLLALEPIL